MQQERLALRVRPAPRDLRGLRVLKARKAAARAHRGLKAHRVQQVLKVLPAHKDQQGPRASMVVRVLLETRARKGLKVLRGPRAKPVLVHKALRVHRDHKVLQAPGHRAPLGLKDHKAQLVHKVLMVLRVLKGPLVLVTPVLKVRRVPLVQLGLRGLRVPRAVQVHRGHKEPRVLQV